VLRVLVADDNGVNRKLASAILQRAGHVISMVENGGSRELTSRASTVRPRRAGETACSEWDVLAISSSW